MALSSALHGPFSCPGIVSYDTRCVTTSTVPEMAWVRADDPALLQQGKSDIAACDANLDSETPTASTPGCMAQSGYVFVRRNQAEDVRAAVAAQRVRPTDNEHSWQSVSWPALV